MTTPQSFKSCFPYNTDICPKSCDPVMMLLFMNYDLPMMLTDETIEALYDLCITCTAFDLRGN